RLFHNKHNILMLTNCQATRVKANEKPALPLPLKRRGLRRVPFSVMQRLIHTLDKKGEVGTATILRQVGERGEVAGDLAYRLYTVCERKGGAQEALAYNSLVMPWSEVGRLARRESGDVVQGTFLV